MRTTKERKINENTLEDGILNLKLNEECEIVNVVGVRQTQKSDIENESYVLQ